MAHNVSHAFCPPAIDSESKPTSSAVGDVKIEREREREREKRNKAKRRS
jgi:hypothetical protein